MATVYGPATDEALLEGDPNSFEWGKGEWQDYGGGPKAGRFLAWKKFSQMFGRNPTESELSMLSQAYMSGDKNLTNGPQGDAAVAQFFQSMANSPQNQLSRDQAMLDEKSPKHYGTVDSMFQQKLGRAATDAERKHFGGLIASGNADEYGIGQFLDALPENVRRQDEEFRKNMSADLQGQDERYFSEKIMPSIQANASKSGRSLDASGVQAQLANAAKEQNRGRESFLSGLSASQYAGSQGLAQDAYARAYGSGQDLSNYARARSNTLTDALSSRLNSISDFNMQKQAYDQYLQRYGKRSSGMGKGMGSLLGMGLGAALAVPTGGVTVAGGAMLGGMGGGAFGSFFD